MEKAFWYNIWASNKIGFNQSKPNQLLTTYFEKLNLKQGLRIFVPLCGQSIDMLWLMNQGYQVLGVELSSIACNAFFNTFAIPFKIIQLEKFTLYQSKNISLLCGDLFDLDNQLLGKIDAIYDKAALIALPDDLRQHYASFLAQITKQAPMLLIAYTYNQNEMPGPPFSVDENKVKALYNSYYTIQLLCHQATKSIPKHLANKGLTAASEEVYYLYSA